MTDYLRQFKPLFQPRDGLPVYNAGLPRFPRNFTRDAIISSLLADDPMMMKEQLRFCALHQGTKVDPISGEEPGKIHHEYPGFPIDGKITTYNGCDTTAFFLIGHDYYMLKTGDFSLLHEQKGKIEAAVRYIQTHLNEKSLFEDGPSYVGADRFALKVTYWKDSVILDRTNGFPLYPAVFTLAHCQNLCAMRSAAHLLQQPHIYEVAAKMALATYELYDHKLGTFYTALDQKGPIPAVTSDALHALYYLEPDDLPAEWVTSIVRVSEALESHIGYMLMTPEDGKRMTRSYHADTVWPFEQALIHAAALKFDLERVQRVSQRVTRVLEGDSFPELMSLNVVEPGISSNPQLWTIASKHYFEKN